MVNIQWECLRFAFYILVKYNYQVQKGGSVTGSASSEYTMEIKKNPRLKLGLAGLAQFSKKNQWQSQWS